MTQTKVHSAVLALQNKCHNQAREAGWWDDITTGRKASRPVGKVEAMNALIKLEDLFDTDSITINDSGVEWSDVSVLLQTLNDFIITRNTGEMLMLMVSELAEAMEADRKGLMDDKLPHRPGMEVEMADLAIRMFDVAGGLNLDLAGAVVEKLEFNKQREDHQVENRRSEGGKKY